MLVPRSEIKRVRVAREPRDQIGHWVIPSGKGKPCHHACCRGYRPHPKNLPVKLDRAYLRSLSEDELVQELDTYQRYNETHEKGFLQIIAEAGRREDAAAAKERARDKRRRRADEHHDEVYRQWLAAEAATNGYMLNAAGKAAGINERSLFTGPASRVRKYASPELKEWFQEHGRPTAGAYARGGQRYDIRQ